MTVLADKVSKYMEKASPMFDTLRTATPSEIDAKAMGGQFLEMALAYYQDAKHFLEEGNQVNALAALEYAEGWLDAGKRIGILEHD